MKRREMPSLNRSQAFTSEVQPIPVNATSSRSVLTMPRQIVQELLIILKVRKKSTTSSQRILTKSIISKTHSLLLMILSSTGVIWT